MRLSQWRQEKYVDPLFHEDHYAFPTTRSHEIVRLKLEIFYRLETSFPPSIEQFTGEVYNQS